MTNLSPMAVSSAPLLRAIAAGGDQSPKTLAEASGRKANNISRDLSRLEEAGLITREPGSPIVLTDEANQALALIDGGAPSPTPSAAPGFAEVELALIDRDPTINPREIFDDEKLEALAASIRDKGVAQPILLRQGVEPGRYRIVAGERRFRASGKAGLTSVPAMIRELSDEQALEIATIENIQRDDLTPLEEARAFSKIVDARMRNNSDLSLKDAKETIAEAVRKTVRYVEQRMDLLELPAMFQVRLELDKDHDQYLSLKEARFEVQRVRREAKEREARKVTDAELLVLAEIHHATKHFAEDLPNHYYVNKLVAIGHRALEDGDIIAGLIKRGMIALEKGWKGDPRNFVRLDWQISDKRLEEYAPGLTKQKTATAVLQGLRARACGVAEAERIGATWEAISGARGEYATWALNEPFISTPDPKLEEAASAWREADAQRRVDEFERNAARQEREEQDRIRSAELAAKRARDDGAEGQALCEAVRQLEQDAPGLDQPSFTQRFSEILASYNISGPYHLVLEGDDGHIRDGHGADTSAASWALEARRRLICMAMNYASGLNVYSGPDLDLPHRRPPSEPAPAPAGNEPLSRDDFLRHVAGFVADDMDVDEATAQDYAARSLNHLLESEEIEFGDESFGWDYAAAQELAEAIRTEGYGITDPELEREDA